jgi:hypothetical protein
MPCGQKKRTREMIQSQMVTPPLAAMEGTTFRLKTATTKRRTRSRRPRARIRWGWAADWVVVDKVFAGCTAAGSSPGFAWFGMTNLSSLPKFRFYTARTAESGCPHMSLVIHKSSARPAPVGLSALAALSPTMPRCHRRQIDAYRCRLRCAGRKSSIARPTSRAAASRRG